MFSQNDIHISHLQDSASSHGSLADRGAKGGLAPEDVCVLERTGRKVFVAGIDDHEVPGLDIVTCVALIQTSHGKFNMLMHEYAYYGRGNTIHSHVRLSDSTIHVMTNLIMLEVNKSSHL